MALFKYISFITEEELEKNVVVPCMDEDGFSCILIKNSLNKSLSSSYSTDNLNIGINRVLTKDGKDYFVHIIKAKKNDSYSKSQFETIFNYVFSKISSEVSDIELAGLITSLEDYFKTTPDSNKREIQIGVFGELLTIKYLYDCGYTDIVNKYHTNFYSKHDVEISDRLRLEIKTTTSEKRIHHFKHNQLVRKDVDVIISSLLLEEAKEGLSLKEMFNIVMPLFVNTDSIFALKKLMIRCGLNDENEGMSFSFDKALSEIYFFENTNIPHLEEAAHEGVTNIEYDVDCSNCGKIANVDLFLNKYLY